jgi:hypothetical protein
LTKKLNVPESPELFFDPWAGCPDPRVLSRASRESMSPVELCPMEWLMLKERSREIIGGGAVGLLARFAAEHPGERFDVHRLRHRLWEAVRYEKIDARHTVEDDLCAVSPFILREVLERLAAVGDVERTLIARRDALDRQLVRIQRMRTGNLKSAAPAEAEGAQ